MLRILTTTLLPSGGQAWVLGHDVVAEAWRIRNDIAVVPQEALTDPDLTGWESVYGYLLARGFSRAQAEERAEAMLRQLGLWEARHRTTGTYSGGMKRRTIIAMALATGARLIFLDEPTNGLDPVAKREVWSLLHGLKGQSTLVLTTHLMDEVEAIADQVLVLAEGRLLAGGTVAQLRALAPAREKILVDKAVPVDSLAPFGRVYEHGGRWVLFPASQEAVHRAVDLVRGYGLGIGIEPANLEDAYLALLQEEGAQAGAETGTERRQDL